MVFGGGDSEGFADGLFVEKQSGDHVGDIARPAHGRLNVTGLNGQDGLFACEGAADGVRSFLSDELIAHERIGDGGADDGPVAAANIVQNLLSTAFIDGIVIGVPQEGVVR